MASLATLINEVGADLGNRTDLTADCSDAVTLCIRHYDHRKWWFQEGSATFTASAASTYSLPSDYRGMAYMEVMLSSGIYQQVYPRTFPEIKRALEQTAAGTPNIYSVEGGNVWLYPQPGAAGELAVRYYYRRALSNLTASASNAWTNDCKGLIRAAAAKTVSLRTLHDPELARLHSDVEQWEFDRLLEENEGRLSTGRAEPHY